MLEITWRICWTFFGSDYLPFPTPEDDPFSKTFFVLMMYHQIIVLLAVASSRPGLFMAPNAMSQNIIKEALKQIGKI